MEATYLHPGFAVNPPRNVLGKTGTYEGFGKQSTDEKTHSFFKWAKNRELKFCLEDETKLEFGQESTFITNFITNQN